MLAHLLLCDFFRLSNTTMYPHCSYVPRKLSYPIILAAWVVVGNQSTYTLWLAYTLCYWAVNFWMSSWNVNQGVNVILASRVKLKVERHTVLRIIILLRNYVITSANGEGPARRSITKQIIMWSVSQSHHLIPVGRRRPPISFLQTAGPSIWSKLIASASLRLLLKLAYLRFHCI